MNVKISQLESTWGYPLNKFDVLPIVNANKTKKVTLKELETYVMGGQGTYSFVPAKPNDPTGPDPNVPAAPIDELVVSNPARTNAGAGDYSYYSPDRAVALPTLIVATGKQVQACLIKITAKGVLFRSKGIIGVQIKRSFSEAWSASNETMLEVSTSAPHRGYKVNESSTELVYIDIPTNSITWRVIDPETAEAVPATGVTYDVKLELLGFYVTSV